MFGCVCCVRVLRVRCDWLDLRCLRLICRVLCGFGVLCDVLCWFDVCIVVSYIVLLCVRCDLRFVVALFCVVLSCVGLVCLDVSCLVLCCVVLCWFVLCCLVLV